MVGDAGRRLHVERGVAEREARGRSAASSAGTRAQYGRRRRPAGRARSRPRSANARGQDRLARAVAADHGAHARRAERDQQAAGQEGERRLERAPSRACPAGTGWRRTGSRRTRRTGHIAPRFARTSGAAAEDAEAHERLRRLALDHDEGGEHEPGRGNSLPRTAASPTRAWTSSEHAHGEQDGALGGRTGASRRGTGGPCDVARDQEEQDRRDGHGEQERQAPVGARQQAAEHEAEARSRSRRTS